VEIVDDVVFTHRRVEIVDDVVFTHRRVEIVDDVVFTHRRLDVYKISALIFNYATDETLNRKHTVAINTTTVTTNDYVTI
jgi:hypothetical protein